LRRGHGRILFTSSIAAEMPGPYYAAYAASKAFLQSFSEAIREEVKDSGVVVTALQPGPTDTNFFARAGMLDTKAGQAKKDSPEKVAQDGYDALMHGKDHVVAGSLMNQIQALMARFISEPQAAKTHAKQTKPGSAYHH
jgi:short-subunit dehydrogenase